MFDNQLKRMIMGGWFENVVKKVKLKVHVITISVVFGNLDKINRKENV